MKLFFTVKKYFLARDNLSQKLIHKKNYLDSRKNVPICDRIFKINYLKERYLRKFILFKILFFYCAPKVGGGMFKQ